MKTEHINICIKIAFLIAFIVLGYLFATNGRYTKIDENVYFDKWNQTILITDKEVYVR